MAPGALVLLLVQLVAAQMTITGTVLDVTGAPVAGARVVVAGATSETSTAADGTFAIAITALPATLIVRSPGFADRSIPVDSARTSPVHVVLEPLGISAELTVSASADRARISTPAAATVLDSAALGSAPALALDDQLRTVPGFSLFRRSSSRVANPTTQGVTLRGLAASGASRATVFVDDVPLTDPFGGWVYWDRVPAAAIERVEVARGGASDVYGSDAMGGAIRIETSSSGARLIAEAGEQRTGRVSAFAGRTMDARSLRGGAEQFTTDGFVTVAPESRGPIDTPADSRHTALFAAAAAPLLGARVEARGGYYSEHRGNGTPFQTNATTGRDLAISASGAAFDGYWTVRGVFTSQDYDQTFSAVFAARDAERPTSTQAVASSSQGVGLEWARSLNAWTFVAAATGRRVRADLATGTLPNPSGSPPSVTSADQRTGAVSSQASWALSPRATFGAGLRAELRTTTADSEAQATRVGSFVPRVSFAFRATPSVTVRASLQDAYRAPTINELYRGFRVGSVQTLPNASLSPERSFGGDLSILVTRGPAVMRATGFFATVNDAIVNVTVSRTPALILRRRDNAGRIHAAGLEIESDVRVRRGLSATLSGTFGSSTFGGDGELGGLRVPQIPRVQMAAGLRQIWTHANVSVDWRYTGRQFDDDQNQFVLKPSAITDARAAWTLRAGLDVFVAVENVFDMEQDVGRTPLRTIGLPRTARVGVRLTTK